MQKPVANLINSLNIFARSAHLTSAFQAYLEEITMSSAPKFILVTRPQPEGDRLCIMLDNAGFKAVAAPLISIEYPACPPIEYHDIQALIATSKNGLRALMKSQYKNFFFKIPLFAVGSSTALLAKTLGFSQIYQGNGHAKDLIPLILKHCKTQNGTLFHLAGSVLATDLKNLLQQQDFHVIAPIIYHARAAKHLPEKIKVQLAMGQIDRVILMSPRIAQIFANVMEEEGLSHLIETITFYCLSENIATSLREALPNINLTIRISEKPNQDQLLSLIVDSPK